MAPALDYDPIQLNRIIVQNLRLSMILSENRHPLFGIMLQGLRKAKMAAQMWRKMRRRSIAGSNPRAWRELFRTHRRNLSHRPLQQHRQRATKKSDFFRVIHRRHVGAAPLLPAQSGDKFLSVAAPCRLVAGFPFARGAAELIVGGATLRRLE